MKKLRVLSVIGSPHDYSSNTRTLIEDFVEELISAGINLDHQVISLGKNAVEPCRGCWNCTRDKACPIKDDKLESIKKAMIECDILILGSPVYTNQVSAQMKALFDRLFTWCHIFPLLGKYSFSAVTTAGDGQKETGAFIEKMLATYGTFSFGTITATGAYTPDFFPQREASRISNRKMARKAAEIISKNELPKQSLWLKKMFTVMKRKISGIHVVNYIVNGENKDMPNPPKMLIRIINTAIKKRNVPHEQTVKLSKLMQFELQWWQERNWLNARSIKQLMTAEPKPNFDLERYLLGDTKEHDTTKTA